MTTAVLPPVTKPAAARRGWGGSTLGTQLLVLTGHSLTKLKDPRILVMSLLQPMIMVLLFSQVFRSIANTPNFPKGVSYIDYLLPAILVTTAAQFALMSGAGFATDLKNGVLARFRSLPIRQVAPLAGRSLSDLVRSAVQLTIIVLAAVAALGFRPAGGIAGTLAAMGLALAIGWGVSWIFLALAAWIRQPEAMQMFGFVAMFPLMFASSAYVPVDALPGWLQAIATYNPMTFAIDAARGLALGSPDWSATLYGIVGAAALSLIGAAAAAKAIRRP